MELSEDDAPGREDVVRLVSSEHGLELRYRLPARLVADSEVFAGVAESPGNASIQLDPSDVFKWLGSTLAGACDSPAELAASLRVASFLGCQRTRAAAAQQLGERLLDAGASDATSPVVGAKRARGGCPVVDCLAKLSSDLTHAVFASAPASLLRMLGTLPAALHASAVQSRTALAHMPPHAPPVCSDLPLDPAPPVEDAAAPPLRTLFVATARDVFAEEAAASMALLPAALVLDGARASLLGLYCSCRGGPGIAAPLVTTLRLLPGLRALHLPSNALGDAGAATLAAALPCLRALDSLDLSNNSLAVGAAAALAAARPRLHALTRLDLSTNPLSPRALDSIAALVMHLKRLRVLLLDGVDAADPTRVLACPFTAPPRLSRLALGPAVPAGPTLSELLAQTPHLTALLLPRPWHTEPFRARMLAATAMPVLRALPHLAALDLSAWCRHQAGPFQLAVLSSLTALTWLALPPLERSEAEPPPPTPPTLRPLAGLTLLRHLSVRGAALRDAGAPQPLAPLAALLALTSLDLRGALHSEHSVAAYQAHVAALTHLSQLRAIWLAHSARGGGDAPAADPAAPLPAALLAWPALEAVTADFRGPVALDADAWLRAAPRATSMDLTATVYAHGVKGTPLTLPTGLTHLALCVGHAGDGRGLPPQPVLLPQSAAEAAGSCLPLRSLKLMGCVCGANYAEHVWRCLGALTGLTALALTLPFDRAEEWCAAMTEHLPRLTALESLAVEPSNGPPDGGHGWPAASFAPVVTALQRLTRLQLWDDTRPDAAFWRRVCRELPRLRQVFLRTTHQPADLQKLLSDEHIVSTDVRIMH